jgi:Tol biopolymer transport system component
MPAPTPAPGREPRRVDLRPLVQHHLAQERAKAGAPPPIVADRVDDGWIVYVSEASGAPVIYRMRSSAQERQRLSPESAPHYPVRPLPDGGLLAIEVDEPEHGLHLERLLRIDLAGDLSIAPLSEFSGRARSPSVAPDGAWIVFEGDRASFRDLYRRDLVAPSERSQAKATKKNKGRDAGLRRLTDDPAGNFEPAISPDGRRIAFASSRDGNAEIYVMNADGSEPRRLTHDPHSDTAPSWSPDGRYLAFLSDRGGGDRIYLLEAAALDLPTPPEGLRHRRLTADRDLLAEAEITWAPTSDRIALIGVGDRTTSMWIAEVPTGNLRRLTDDGALDQGPSWSPSGEHVAFASNRDGELDIYRVNADGGAPTRLTQEPGADWLPRWLPEPPSPRAEAGAR